MLSRSFFKFERERLDSSFVFLSCLFFLISAFSITLLAFHYPMELEVRESTGWLHVLAQKAGINIYDGTKVAFINMVYGPVEALLKHFISFLLPFLDATGVTRFFVPFVPLSLWLATYGWLRGRWFDALLLSVPLQLSFLFIDPMGVAIGRPDPTAMCFLSLILYFCSPWVSQQWLPRRKTWIVLLALLSAIVFHTSWRFFPTAVFFIWGSLMNYRIGLSWSEVPFTRLKNEGGLIAAAFFTTSAILLFSVFGWDIGLYYRRVFGFFTAESGWGSLPMPSFSLIPRYLLIDCHLYLSGGALAVALAFWINRHRTAEILFWLPTSALFWLLHSYSFYANGDGGGLRYFFPSFLVLWAAVIYFLPSLEERIPRWRVVYCLVVWIGMPWGQIWKVSSHLWGSQPHANYFVNELRRLPANSRVTSDVYHLYKERYSDEIVDTPDIAYRVAKSGFLGPDFTKTAMTHFDSLLSNPPEFLVLGFIDSPAVVELMKKVRYEKILQAPPHNWGNAFIYPAELYRRAAKPQEK